MATKRLGPYGRRGLQPLSRVVPEASRQEEGERTEQDEAKTPSKENRTSHAVTPYSTIPRWGGGGKRAQCVDVTLFPSGFSSLWYSGDGDGARNSHFFIPNPHAWKSARAITECEYTCRRYASC